MSSTAFQLARRFCVPCLLSVLALSAVASDDESRQQKIANAIREETEAIELSEAMHSRGMGSVESVALSYHKRGQVYLRCANDPLAAERDFTKVLEWLERVPASENEKDSDGIAGSTRAEALLQRARAFLKQDKIDQATQDAQSAVQSYKKLEAGEESLEPLVVYAVKTLMEVLEKSPRPGTTLPKATLADIDHAMQLLEKWSKKGQNDEFFAKQLQWFTEHRATLVRELPAAETGGQDRGASGTATSAAEKPAPAASAAEAHPADTKTAAVWKADDRLFGQWLKDTEYENNLVLPLKIKLSGQWRRADPPACPLFAQFTNGSDTESLSARASAATVQRALVAYARADYGRAIHAMELEIQARPRGYQWSDCLEQSAVATLTDAREVAPLVATVATNETCWIGGVPCFVLDLDSIYTSETVCSRIYYVPAGEHVVMLNCSFTNTGERKAINSLIQDMADFGSLGVSGPATSANERQFLERFRQLLARAAAESEAQKIEEQIETKIEERQLLVQAIESRKDRGTERGFFGGDAERFANFQVIDELRQKAFHAGDKAAGLRAKHNAFRLKYVWSQLNDQEKAIARRLVPTLASPDNDPLKVPVLAKAR
jgi:hypothetical protein